MTEFADQYIRRDLQGKCSSVSRLLTSYLADESLSEDVLLRDRTLYPIATALAKASLVPEFNVSEGSAGMFDVLRSFNAAQSFSQGGELAGSAADAVLVARVQYLTLVRRQSIKLRAAALEAGQRFISLGLGDINPNENNSNANSKQPFELSSDQVHRLVCLADLSTIAELEKARQLLGTNVKMALSGIPYKGVCTAYQWLGFAAVAPLPYSDIAEDMAIQLLFQPGVLRRGLEQAPWLLLQQLFIYLNVRPSEAMFSYAQVLLLELLTKQNRQHTYSSVETSLPATLMAMDVCARALQASQLLRQNGQGNSLSFLRGSAIAKITGGVFIPPVKQDYAYPELTFAPSYSKRTGIFVAIDSHWGFEPSGQSEVAQVIKKGAALVISSDQNRAPGGQYLEVRNTFTALVKLSLARRAAFRGRVIGVTGSVGKTTVCSMVTSLLGVHGEVYKNIANFNHQPGVPKSIANVPRTARYAVIEMGMGAKRTILPKAVMVRPHTAVVTDIQADHMEFHESVTSVVTTKMEIIWGVESGGTVVLNRDSEYFATLHGLALQRSDINILTFGQHPQADICAEDIVLEPARSVIQVRVFQQNFKYTLGLPGVHMALNSLVAVAVIVSEGVDLATSLPVLEKLGTETRRNQKIRVTSASGARIQILDDSFNTNPASIRSNLHLLGLMQPESEGRRILILSDMGEMGSEALHYHTALAQDINDSQIDIFLSIGDHCRALDQLIENRITHKHFNSVEALEIFLQEVVRNGDIVSFKGSAREATMLDLVKRFTSGGSRENTSEGTPTLVEFFNRRFKENAYNLTKISDQEQEAIAYLVQQTLAIENRSSEALWLIDYGCGDGRLQPLYNLLAETYATTEFHVLGVDFAIEALKAYRTHCIQDDFQETKRDLNVEGDSSHHQLPPLKRGNVTVHFLEGGVEALQNIRRRPDQKFEILVAAGVLCRVLGEDRRREMVEAFSQVAASAFVSMPTQDEFKSIQSEFNTLRTERLQLLSQIEDPNRNGIRSLESAQQRLSVIEEILKDALVDGEIYYSAKRVRGFGEKVPDLKNHKIPYFSATEAQAQQVIDYGAYGSTSVKYGAFGGHSRWMICLGSHSFSVDSVENSND
jgi:UDP-N-acetylmuramoyl-tripeptide--D-alanyl-D-alanine ligase